MRRASVLNSTARVEGKKRSRSGALKKGNRWETKSQTFLEFLTGCLPAVFLKYKKNAVEKLFDDSRADVLVEIRNRMKPWHDDEQYLLFMARAEAVFLGALLFNLARGLEVECGCFSTELKGNPNTAWYLIRDTGFLLMSAWLAFEVKFREKRGGCVL